MNSLGLSWHGFPLSLSNVKRIFLLVVGLLVGFSSPVFSVEKPNEKSGPFSTMFWTWQDDAIENPNVLLKQLHELKSAGFDGLFAMPRATRYQIFDDEMIAAVKLASDACQREGIEFIWGPDPRFGAHYIIGKTGFGAEVLLTGAEFLAKTPPQNSTAPADRAMLNECKVENGRYSLRYNYPQKRDVHMLTEVGLWLNPIGVDKVFAYQRKDGQVVKSSIRDITAQHHFFINRSLYYVEVFGKPELPPGEWWVVAFPRFATNLYAFDAPEHEQEMMKLLGRYKAEGIRFNGFWWDEPGYYLQFGHYAISERIYRDFHKKYGYDLKDKLYALLLSLDDESQMRVRDDYFQLVMDYVFGAEERMWKEGEKRFGPLRMGIHQNWHTIPDNMYHGSADYWRGLAALDSGYTDAGSFEKYFKSDLASKYEEVSYMILATSLARYSKTGRAYFNQWGVNYDAPVPIYWNDLMALFSNHWIQHSYGTTKGIGAGRDFGPGFPNHSTWPLLPSLIEKTRRVYDITQYRLPVAEVAVVCPLATMIVGREPENDEIMSKVNRLVGAMPAAGVQVDMISDNWLAEGVLENGVLRVGRHSYKAIVLPCARVVTAGEIAVLEKLVAAKFPIHVIDEEPATTVEGKRVSLGLPVAFKIEADASGLVAAISKMKLPSPVTALPGAYVSVIPSDGDDLLVAIMPITPSATVSGQILCRGQKVMVKSAASLSIYRVGREGVKREL
ncbi:MAG: hypothetical protein QM790_12165 [Nibricoccus sp.]